MKRILPLALGLLLCHCGTEVGNGIAPEPKETQATPTSAPQAEGSTQDESISGPAHPYGFAASFIAACASPFAESIDGTFLNVAASTEFTVTLNADGKKTVTSSNGSTIIISTAPALGSYAIEALTLSPQVTCSTVTTVTLSDGSLQRSVTLSDGHSVQWTLTSGRVSSMKVTTPGMSEESWTRR